MDQPHVVVPRKAHPMSDPCVFCAPHQNDAADSTALSYSRWDGNPVAPGHLLIIPRQHVESWFDLSARAIVDMHRLAVRASQRIVEADGWTIGINEGVAAGRTVHHVHMHLIPRRFGDVPDPRGGIRHVLPGRGWPDTVPALKPARCSRREAHDPHEWRGWAYGFEGRPVPLRHCDGKPE